MSSNHSMPRSNASELTAQQLDVVCGGIIIVGGKAFRGGDATVLSYAGAVASGTIPGGIAHLGGHVI